MREIKRIAKFEGLEPRRCEDIKGIVVPDIGPKSFGTFEKQAPGRQNDEKMSRKIGNAQSLALLFRHSAVLSLPAVRLCKVTNNHKMEPISWSMQLYYNPVTVFS